MIFNCASCLLWFKGFTISLETSLNSMCSPYLPLFSPCCLGLPARQSCLFASPPPSLPLYLSLECRCLVKITLAMPCYANDYQLSTCLPLLLQQLPIQTCQKKCLYYQLINLRYIYISLHCLTSRRLKDHLKLRSDSGQMEIVGKCKSWARRCHSVCAARISLSSIASAAQSICNQEKSVLVKQTLAQEGISPLN